MSKTNQTWDTITQNNFFKLKYFEFDYIASELLQYNKINQKIEVRTDLNNLIAIDSDLRTSLCEDHRKYFSDYYNGPITLPKNHKYPFTLHFDDGSIQLLWAETKEDFGTWTKAFMSFLPS